MLSRAQVKKCGKRADETLTTFYTLLRRITQRRLWREVSDLNHTCNRGRSRDFIWYAVAMQLSGSCTSDAAAFDDVSIIQLERLSGQN